MHDLTTMTVSVCDSNREWQTQVEGSGGGGLHCPFQSLVWTGFPPGPGAV